MAGEQRIVLLSVRPKYARAILEGNKTVELRRVHMLAPAGSLLLLYSSSPTKALVGTAILDRIQGSTPRGLWHEVRNHAGVTRGEYDEYFRGAPRAFALHLRNIEALSTPAPLAAMRADAGIEPAQSFRYVTAAQAELLVVGLPHELVDTIAP